MTHPNTTYTYLIIGGGMVADSAARGIRELDTDGTIGILSREDNPPVARPALSKKLWTDPSFTFEDVWLNTAADTGAVFHAGETAVSVDRDAHTVRTHGGNEFGYRRLLLATGGTPNTLDIPDDDRVIYFRTVDDYRRLRELSGEHRRIAVVGGSFIATEIAAALVQNGAEPVLIYPEDVLGEKVFPSGLAQQFETMYRDNGVDLVPGTTVGSGTAGADGITLTLSSGDTVECTAVVVGVGVSPDIGLAEDAGLKTVDGVVVDDRLRTVDPDILAAGDIAEYPDAILGRSRIEHVDNATTMGRQAGRNLAGADEPYDHTPYFYSAVFGNRYEAVGTLDASLETVESWGGEHGVVYYIDGSSVVGVLLWNISGRRDAARDAVAHADATDPEVLKNRIPVSDADD